jgi:hypothetical protein
MIYAAIQKNGVGQQDDYNKTIYHAGGNGFYGFMGIRIEQNGYVNRVDLFDLYVLHGIVLSVCWGLLALL